MRVTRDVVWDDDDHCNSYHLLDILGRGNFGEVRRCVTRHEATFAMKIMSKYRLKKHTTTEKDVKGNSRQVNGLHRIQREIEIMKYLRHENIIRMVEVIDDPDDENVMFVLDYYRHGSVLCFVAMSRTYRRSSYFDQSDAKANICSQFTQVNLIVMSAGSLSCGQVMCIMIDMCQAVQYIHSKGVCHRDIKPENFLVRQDGRVCLADFGCAQHFDSSENAMALVANTVGTPAFWAPESIRISSSTTTACDDAEDWGGGLGLDMDEEEAEVVGVQSSSSSSSWPHRGAGTESKETKEVVFSAYCADYWSLGATLFCLHQLRLPFDPLVAAGAQAQAEGEGSVTAARVGDGSSWQKKGDGDDDDNGDGDFIRGEWLQGQGRGEEEGDREGDYDVMVLFSKICLDPPRWDAIHSCTCGGEGIPSPSRDSRTISPSRDLVSDHEGGEKQREAPVGDKEERGPRVSSERARGRDERCGCGVSLCALTDGLARQVVLGLLEKDPSERWDVGQVMASLCPSSS